ncbi:TPA: DUF1642 domain-containing protein [Streptococcus suis]
MKQNDFYEVNGCTEFIPVTIDETFADGVAVTVHSTEHPFRMTVKQVYQFLKPHEPQKVVVPKFIADKIEYCKNAEGYGLFHAMDYCYQYKDSADWLEYNQENFALAWIYGYEVEQERLYTVEIPDPHSSWKYRYLTKNSRGISIIASDNDKWKTDDRNRLTESEIKQDFEWAWDAGFAEEVGDD